MCDKGRSSSIWNRSVLGHSFSYIKYNKLYQIYLAYCSNFHIDRWPPESFYYLIKVENKDQFWSWWPTWNEIDMTSRNTWCCVFHWNEFSSCAYFQLEVNLVSTGIGLSCYLHLLSPFRWSWNAPLQLTSNSITFNLADSCLGRWYLIHNKVSCVFLYIYATW